MAVEHVVVAGGGGVMGSGIAQVVATAGLRVTIVEVDDAATERGLQRIGRGLEKAGLEADEVLGRILSSTSLEEAGAGADHVIESVIEDIDAKADVLRRLDAVCREDVILASNTSQFPISKLAAFTTRPDRVIGSHWFNPPPQMKLIEVIRGVETSDATLETTLALAERYGKETIVCRKDTPGFVTSRLIASFMIEAARIVEEGIADYRRRRQGMQARLRARDGATPDRGPQRSRHGRARRRQPRPATTATTSWCRSSCAPW